MASNRVANVLAEKLGRAPHHFDSLLRGSGRVVTTGMHVLDAAQKNAPIRIGSLVDVLGVSGVGKTKFLHAIVAHRLTCASPSRTHRARVCWFDLNGGLDIALLSHMLRQRLPGADDQAVRAMLAALLVYRPESSHGMCASIATLPEFFRSDEGTDVDLIVIDALGTFFYVDKLDVERATATKDLTVEIRFIQVVRQLLEGKRVAVYVSKCALFDETKLCVKWPFPKAGVPNCPQDIMQPAWKSIVSHAVLVYCMETALADSVDELVTRRAVLFMEYGNPHRGGVQQLHVCAASVMRISDRDVTCEETSTCVV